MKVALREAQEDSGLSGLAVEGGVFDLDRVAIRGWSFGGFLAALAVLRRPDVFHAAVAGAPVTEWRLYDTAYTERYMRTPQENDDGYPASKISNATALGQNKRFLLMHGVRCPSPTTESGGVQLINGTN